MNHPDGHDSALDQFIWPLPDGIPDRKDLLLRLRAEQRFMAAQDPACRLDQRDYLLSLVDSASTRADGAAQRSGFDARRMRSVITEAATRSHWGKPSGGRRTQGIAAHYDAPGHTAVHLINPTGALQACQPSQMSYVPIVRALCNAICKASDKRTSDVSLRSQLLERTGGR
ncbi:hypothetical protein BK653_12080 [Pseudomonas brassicacearum]|uniref:hypothetical protein n=1 Tax=Pseudomonas brassicacearum TaxID=930166 RepID=UPI000F47773E|nr:hypothetical protein [Pseudomonas brassicacearum]ROM69694.1 hypothetical protein BK653_12080 [Pseudomonas brassicacearum]